VLLFGGYGHPGGDPYFDDTWVYDLSDNMWTEQAPAFAPSAREWHALAYIGGDQVLLFGGDAVPATFGDTWVYDLSDNNWTEQASAAGPSPRYGHAMASLGGGQMLLFGGRENSGWWNDETWLATGSLAPVRVYLPLVLK
jgi:N-acetylneuraminic acid mutarotase